MSKRNMYDFISGENGFPFHFVVSQRVGSFFFVAVWLLGSDILHHLPHQPPQYKLIRSDFYFFPSPTFSLFSIGLNTITSSSMSAHFFSLLWFVCICVGFYAWQLGRFSIPQWSTFWTRRILFNSLRVIAFVTQPTTTRMNGWKRRIERPALLTLFIAW